MCQFCNLQTCGVRILDKMQAAFTKRGNKEVEENNKLDPLMTQSSDAQRRRVSNVIQNTKCGHLRTHLLPRALDEALLKSIAEKRSLKHSFVHRSRSMSSVLKSFGKYQDSNEKMYSRNNSSLQAQMCNNRWRVVSAHVSLTPPPLTQTSHLSLKYLVFILSICTYNACKQNISIYNFRSSCFFFQTDCSLSILPYI